MMRGPDELSCPAFTPIGDGIETIDLMCWLPLDHAGPHMEVRGDEPVMWHLKSADQGPQGAPYERD